MATAYAAFTSLMHLIRDLHEHPRPPIQLDSEQVDFLNSNISFFQRFLEDHHNTMDLRFEVLFVDIARYARNTIDTHVTNQSFSQVNLYQILEEVMQVLDNLIKNEVMEKFENEQSQVNNQPRLAPSRSPSATSCENVVVGTEDVTGKIMDKLTPIISIPAYKFHNRQVDSLCSKIRFVQGFLEDHGTTVDHRFKIQLTDAAHAVESHIKTHIADRICEQEEVYKTLRAVIELTDDIKRRLMEKVANVQSQGTNERRGHPMPLASSQSPSATFAENIVVGIEDITTEIIDKLTSQHKSAPQIISISGVGGIGKTTLARTVYENPYVKNYFDVCVCATLSKEFNMHKSLVELLLCLHNPESKSCLSKKSERDLGDQLYKSLYGRRYLVILDDVWYVEAWERLRLFFPASSGSGIVITTRESTVVSISSHSFSMDLLDECKTWDLFCKKVFGQDSCPCELENVGKKIANICRGLPLSVVVIGGHLAKSPRTHAYWEYIANNLSSVMKSENNEHCFNILSFSYTYLPVYLKACFLHIGTLPEDEEISVSGLIKLWEVDGILKPNHGKSLKEVAEDSIDDLIARNLILASKTSTRGKIKSCKVHDLLRDFCLTEATDKNFLPIVRRQWLEIQEENDDLQMSYSEFCEPTYIRTLTFSGESRSGAHKLLKVLPLGGGGFQLDGEKTLDSSDLVSLQCLKVILPYAGKIHFIVPQSIFFLWNLQSLFILAGGEIEIPQEIWEMPQLRHIAIFHFSLPNPPSASNGILKNLQSAKTITNFRFSEDLVQIFPNLKNLEVCYDGSAIAFKEGAFTLNNIARLERLKSFACSVFGIRSTVRNIMLQNLTFPHSLKKLSIDFLHWDDVTTKIGSLPLLEVLKLSRCLGSEWNLVEEKFVRLKYLKLVLCRDLQCFTADTNHFPRLQKLILHSMDSLDDISSDIGDIATLRSIELRYSPDSAVVSAKEIAEEQYEKGNEELHIKAILCLGSSLYSERLSSSNFHVESNDW